MNSLNSWLPTQLSSAFGLVVLGVIFLIVAIAAMFAWRAISRPHVRGLTKNGRQPRLGLVDSYSVDRVRQLVLVRRDNVEHLIMIGGPNDLLVESTILKSRTAAQATRPAGTSDSVATPERVSTHPPAPRKVEEDFARPLAVELPPVARVEPSAPAPVAATTVAPVAAPVVTPLATVTPAAPTKPSVVPPRDPGFFQRASSRFQTFKNPAPAVPPATVTPAAKEEEEPHVDIDTAHFEELLGAPEKVTPPQTAAPAKPAAATLADDRPVDDFDFEGTDIEPAPEEAEPAFVPQPTTTRLTLPEIRLPDLKLPEWRRPEPAASTEPPAAPIPRPVAEARIEPRFSTEQRPLSGGRIEPTLAPTEPRPQTTEAPARHEPFRVGERLTTPTRPTPTVPAATTQPPAEPEDPFASLEEEMANLLGRTKDDDRNS